MAYELRPRNSALPPGKEVARLLQGEFAHVRIDVEDGLKQAKARAEWIEKAPAGIFLGHHDEALKTASKLKALMPGEALTIEFGDDDTNTLRAVVIPGETIKFGYRSNDEQMASAPLVERCARSLGCDITII